MSYIVGCKYYIYLKINNMSAVSATTTPTPTTIDVSVKDSGKKDSYYFCFQFSHVLFLSTMDYYLC